MEMGMREFRPNLSPYPHALLLLSLATDVISLISLPCTLEGSGGGGGGRGEGAPPRPPSTCAPGRLHCPWVPGGGWELVPREGDRVRRREVPGCGEKMENEHLVEWELEKEVGPVPAAEKPYQSLSLLNSGVA